MIKFRVYLDTLDAWVSSSDALENLDNRTELKTCCERWLRVLAERETSIDAQGGIAHGLAQGSDAELRAMIECEFGPVQRVSDMLWAERVVRVTEMMVRELCASRLEKLARQSPEGDTDRDALLGAAADIRGHVQI